MAKLKTGRHTSALKEARKNKTHYYANKATLSAIRTLSRHLEEAITNSDVQSARSLINQTFSAWDKAAKKNLIHWKSAARTKSRLSLKLHKLVTSGKPQNQNS